MIELLNQITAFEVRVQGQYDHVKFVAIVMGVCMKYNVLSLLL